jgi:hypothetical protein
MVRKNEVCFLAIYLATTGVDRIRGRAEFTEVNHSMFVGAKVALGWGTGDHIGVPPLLKDSHALIADELTGAFPKDKIARKLVGLALVVGEEDFRAFFEAAIGVHHLFELESIAIGGAR